MSNDMEYMELEDKIRNILKELNRASIEINSGTLYYKLKGEQKIYDVTVYYTLLFETPDPFKLMQHYMKLPPNLEYSIYIHITGGYNPSADCIEIVHNIYREHATLLQFFDFLFGFYYRGNFGYKIINDPLEQILEHSIVVERDKFKDSYVCLDYVEFKPYGPDPSSIFHGKRGIVAYCTTFYNYYYLVMTLLLRKYVAEMEKLYNEAESKLEKANFELEDKMKKLYEQNPIDACDIKRILSLISDEVKKVEEILRKYNIVRVALPVD